MPGVRPARLAAGAWPTADDPIESVAAPDRAGGIVALKGLGRVPPRVRRDRRGGRRAAPRPEAAARQAVRGDGGRPGPRRARGSRRRRPSEALLVVARRRSCWSGPRSAGAVGGARVRAARRDAAVHPAAPPAAARRRPPARDDERERERRADLHHERGRDRPAGRRSPTRSSSTIGTSSRGTTTASSGCGGRRDARVMRRARSSAPSPIDLAVDASPTLGTGAAPARRLLPRERPARRSSRSTSAISTPRNRWPPTRGARPVPGGLRDRARDRRPRPAPRLPDDAVRGVAGAADHRRTAPPRPRGRGDGRARAATARCSASRSTGSASATTGRSGAASSWCATRPSIAGSATSGRWSLPGGDAAARATRCGWRSRTRTTRACRSRGRPPRGLVAAVDVVERQIETGLGSPRTSSAGRLFDAVAALAGVCRPRATRGSRRCCSSRPCASRQRPRCPRRRSPRPTGSSSSTRAR